MYQKLKIRFYRFLRHHLNKLLMGLPIENFDGRDFYASYLDSPDMFQSWLKEHFPAIDREEFLRAEQPSRALRIFDAIYETKDMPRLLTLVAMIAPYVLLKSAVSDGLEKREGAIRWLMPILDTREVRENLVALVKHQMWEDKILSVKNFFVLTQIGIELDANRIYVDAQKRGFSEDLQCQLRNLPGYRSRS